MHHSDLGESSWIDLLKWILRLRKRVRISGASMIPLLYPGDEVLVDVRAYQKSLPNVGDIVVAYHPLRENFKIVKRIGRVYPGGLFDLIGENPDASTDSRDFGRIHLNDLFGKVTSRFP